MYIYHNPNCSNSIGALQYMQSHGIRPHIVEYMHEPPSREVLIDILEKLQMKPIAIVRTKEALWQQQFAGKEYSDAEVIELLITHPLLMQRPIVVTDTQAIIARPPEKVLQILP